MEGDGIRGGHGGARALRARDGYFKRVQQDMDLIQGLLYNIRGLWFGLQHFKLLFLGFSRFTFALLIAILMVALVLTYDQALTEFVWSKPESRWILWLWYLFSWFVSLFLVALSALLAYLVAQVLFSVLIMDLMSRITEREVTGSVREPGGAPLWKQLLYLLKQEIPRSIVPLLVSFLILILGSLVALGPIVLIVSSGIAIIFLSWDHTDLVPARQMIPFRERFGFLRKTLLFHIGFGLPFLVPGLNLLFLSFAPVGGTLYYIDKQDHGRKTGKGKTHAETA
jgi:CysZ protein